MTYLLVRVCRNYMRKAVVQTAPLFYRTAMETESRLGYLATSDIRCDLHLIPANLLGYLILIVLNMSAYINYFVDFGVWTLVLINKLKI